MKWFIGIVVIALAAAGLWWSGWLGKMIPSPTATSTPQSQTPTTTPQVQAPLNGMSANEDASDAALIQDVAAIDAQMQAYTTDSAEVDSSLNDKSVQ